MRLSDAVEGFRIDRLGSGYSPRTVQLYMGNLGVLIDFLDDKDVAQVTSKDLKKFLYFLQYDYKPKRLNGQTKPLSPASVDNYYIAIRSFFRWCTKEFNIERPDNDHKRPEYKAPETIPFSEKEIKALIRGAEIFENPGDDRREPFTQGLPKSERNKALILLLLDTGIRLGELTRIRMEDLSLENASVTIRPYRSSRKSQPRNIPLGKTTVKALWRYVAEGGKENGDMLFDLAPSGVQSMLKRLGLRMDVDNVYPHRFRHTFAIEFLKNGGDVYTLKYILGHSSLDMVERYLNLARIDKKGAHRRASPADRWLSKRR